MVAGMGREGIGRSLDYKQHEQTATLVQEHRDRSRESLSSPLKPSEAMRLPHANSIDFLSITRFGLQHKHPGPADTTITDSARHDTPSQSSDGQTSGPESSTAADCETHRSGEYEASFAQFEREQQQQQRTRVFSASATAEELDLLLKCVATSDLSRTDRQRALSSLEKLQDYTLRKPVQNLCNDAASAGCGRAYGMELRMLERRLDSLNAIVEFEAKTRASMSALYDYEFMRVGYDMFVTKGNADALHVQMRDLAENSGNGSAVEEGILKMHAIAEMVVEEKNGKLQATMDEEQKRRAALTVLVEGLPSDIASVLEKCDTSVGNVQTLFRRDLESVRDALDVNKQEMGQRTSGIAGEVCELRKALDRTNTHLIDLQKEVSCVQQGATPHVGGLLQTSSGAATDSLKSSSRGLEKLSLRSVEDRLEQLRRTTIGFDSDLDRANYRISQLESDVRKAFDDRDTAELELQLGDLSAKHDALAAKVDHDSTATHFLGCVSTVAFDLEVLHINARIAELEKSGSRNVQNGTLAAWKEQLDGLTVKHFKLVEVSRKEWERQEAETKRLRCEVEGLPGRAALGDIDLGDLYNRLDMAADFDIGLLDRMDNIEMQLGLPMGGSASGGPLRQNRSADWDDEYDPL
ncbi:hypothetical protein LTR15_005736 [Elasticomyces elasticus]|nr:hypothetical protein LTR15_005736 [Elasticomyces elasticus]